MQRAVGAGAARAAACRADFRSCRARSSGYSMWRTTSRRPQVLAAALRARPLRGPHDRGCGHAGGQGCRGDRARTRCAASITGCSPASSDEPRGLTRRGAAARLPPLRGSIELAADVATACAASARERARAGDRIVVFGSFHVVGPALSGLGYTEFADMENRLKERLTGAAILVALIVLWCPRCFTASAAMRAARPAAAAKDRRCAPTPSI